MVIISKKIAAERLGLSLSTVKRLISAGRLKHVKLSDRRVGILESDLTAFVEAGRGV